MIPLEVDHQDSRPIQLPRAVTDTLDTLRFKRETWSEFMWRTVLSPRGYVRWQGVNDNGEMPEEDDGHAES